MAAIRASAALNRAYAFVRSERFGAAASELAEGLRRKGFEAGEAARAIELRQAALPGMDGEGSLFGRSDAVFLDRGEADADAPCKRGSFALPRLATEVQGELVFTADDAYDALEGPEGTDRSFFFARYSVDYKEIIYIEFGAVRGVSEPNRSIDGGLETASPASRRPIWR